MEENKANNSNKRLLLIMGVVIAVLATTTIYFFLKTKDKQEQVETLSVDKDRLENEMKDLDKQIDKLEEDLATKDKDNNELKAQLTKTRAEIARYQGQINKLLKDGKLKDEDRARLESKLQELQFLVERYQNKIAELETKNKELTTEIKTLASKTKIQDSTIKELVTTDKTNKQIIAAGSQLVATDFKFYGVNKRGKEREAKENRDIKGMLKAKKTRIIKVCFDVNKNPIAEVGDRNLYMVIKSPSGQVYRSPINPGGFITLGGQEHPVSARLTIKYARETINVCMEYDKGDEANFELGNHSVVIYAKHKESDPDSYEVGRDVFNLN